MSWVLLLPLISICLTVTTASASDTKPGCQGTCGNVTIPYPFGIGDACSIDEGFNLICNESSKPMRPYWGDYDFLEISLQGEATVTTYISSECYNESDGYYYTSYPTMYLEYPFTFSNTRNRFTAIGCDINAYINGSWPRNFTSGCLSFCWDDRSAVDDSCSGIGCCQTLIPAGVQQFDVEIRSSNERSRSAAAGFNPCIYAFLIDEEQFSFRASDLLMNGSLNADTVVPTVVEWAIGNGTCESAKRDAERFACVSENSNCSDSSHGLGGYRCNCLQGYRGNPYLKGGCKDIDECTEKSHNCTGKCHNTEGSYVCKQDRILMKVILGISISLLFLLIASFFIYLGLKQRKLIKLKENFFHQNGGFLLQQQITSHQDVAMASKIFTAEELKRATNNYDKTRILGQGGYGTVYKGILSDNRTVAIKKSKIVDENQVEQFINEVFILSQINHRNVVKLLGCCLETQVPLLVYEFVSNGTLFHQIHDESMSFDNRLRIATETAGALSYLHSAASIPILHRDVKSVNILLDDNLTAKVSDFGASRFVPLDKKHITTLVQGTFGYLDPEYFRTGQLTEKSDVYSFGVVLIELLTGEEPISMTRSEEERSLCMYFVSSMKENRLFQVLEDRVVSEGDVEQLLAISQLAKRCLKVKGEERPTMKEVAMELEGLRRFRGHSWAERNREETERLIGEPSERYSGNNNAVGPDSIGNRTMSALEIGR